MDSARFTFLFAAICLLTLLAVQSTSASSQVFYVSCDGSDNSPGTESQPFKTLEKAKSAVRAINSGMQSDITVYIRAGQYDLQNTLTFDSGDSGTNGFKIIYKNYPGERPIISGGKRVTGWVQDGDRWKANVGTSLQTRQLYVNGVRATRAKSKGGLPGAKKTSDGYTTSDSNVKNWKNIHDVELVNKNNWKLFRCGIESISGTKITMKQPCWDNAQAHKDRPMGNPDWIENAYELLDSPGEWYFDRSSGWIYYMPLSGQQMDTATVIVPVLEVLVDGTGTIDSPVRNIKFEGLVFSYATWLRPNTDEGFPELQANVMWGGFITPGNINFSQARSIDFNACTFSHLGAAGLRINKSREFQISGNHFYDISGSGISVGERSNDIGNSSEVTRNINISNNYIHNVAVEYMGGVGVWLGIVQNCSIANNEISDLPYSGVSVGWKWNDDETFAKDNKVQNNYIHDLVKTMVDGGGVYSLGAQPGNVYSGNVITGQANDYGALYLDQGSSHITAFDNVLANNKRSVHMNKDAGDNYLHDNWWENKANINSGGNTIKNNRTISQSSEAPASIVGNAGIQETYKSIKNDVAAGWQCTPGAVFGCQVCDAAGNVWQDSDSKCATGQKCQNAACTGAAIICTNECSINQKRCTDSTHYQTCGVTDSCLGWGSVTLCPASRSCVDGDCANTAVCVPKTCTGMGNYICGSYDDGCGNILQCGSCDSGKFCSGGICVKNCTPKTCLSLNYNCGSWDDGCGETLNCGSCASGNSCYNGVCVSQSQNIAVNDDQIQNNQTEQNNTTISKTANQMTRVEILAKIAGIQQLIAYLQKQLLAITNGSPLPAEYNALIQKYSCSQINNNLYFGMKNNPEVKCLQEILINLGFDTIANGNYGPMTRTAVKLFQQKYAKDILDPYGLSSGSGNVGNATRAKINLLFAE